uniref:Uncharacterized protein n=1 Tax=Daphnia galeata TaxID=27404 RepID=A0A8J2W543_9CRUS|nr:unnamed protein product [Daphnia galeata]
MDSFDRIENMENTLRDNLTRQKMGNASTKNGVFYNGLAINERNTHGLGNQRKGLIRKKSATFAESTWIQSICILLY